MKKIYLLLIFLFFVGCGKSSFVMIDKSPKYKEALEYTQKQQLKNYLQTLAVFRASYLNPIYPDRYKDKEYFFIGVYIENDIKDKSGLDNPLFELKLNDQKPIKITKLDHKKSTLIKELPLTNRWSHYYIVEFKQQTKKLLKLTYHHKLTSKQITFTFQKSNSF